jgi:hypothetical protein
MLTKGLYLTLPSLQPTSQKQGQSHLQLQPGFVEKSAKAKEAAEYIATPAKKKATTTKKAVAVKKKP